MEKENRDMNTEATSDLGSIRLGIPFAYIVLAFDAIGGALLAWSPSPNLKAFGALVVGVSIGLLCGPRLKVWKV